MLLKATYPDAVSIDLLKAEVFRRYLNNPEFLRQETPRSGGRLGSDLGLDGVDL